MMLAEIVLVLIFFIISYFFLLLLLFLISYLHAGKQEKRSQKFQELGLA